MQTTRKTPLLIISAVAMCLCTVAWKASATSASPPAQPTAIATVDIVAIIDGLEERQVRENDLNIRTNARQSQLDDVITQIKTLQTNISEVKDRTTPEYKEQIRQLMELRAVADARREALSQIVSIDLGSVRRDMYLKVSDAIARIAQREGYDLVMLDDSLFPLPENAADPDVYRAIITKSVMYRADSTDITNDVVTLMNNEFSAP